MNLRTLRSALPVSMATDGPTSCLLAAIARWTMRRCTVWQRRHGSIGLMACARCSTGPSEATRWISAAYDRYLTETASTTASMARGECTATSFAWSTATQSMEAFPNAPLAANDLAALTTGEALIVARFPNNVTAARLAEKIRPHDPHV